MNHTVNTVSGIEYRRPDGQALCLDLHRPETDAEPPCVVYFHGGGWARGSRDAHAHERLRALTAYGVAVASVSYRLVDVATHPAQLDDARAAVAWLRAHGREHRLRTERIGAWGASAGAWIALMLNLTQGEPAGAVQAVAAWFPPTDLTSVASQRAAARRPVPAFMEGRPLPDMAAGLLGLERVSDDPAAARAASPTTHAASASGPTLLIHGDDDGLINVQQSIALHHALLDAGQDSQLILLAGANHEDPGFHTPAVLAATAGFFSALL